MKNIGVSFCRPAFGLGRGVDVERVAAGAGDILAEAEHIALARLELGQPESALELLGASSLDQLTLRAQELLEPLLRLLRL